MMHIMKLMMRVLIMRRAVLIISKSENSKILMIIAMKMKAMMHVAKKLIGLIEVK